jgi:hypothetical protein
MGCFDHLSSPFQILLLVFDARYELLGADLAMLRQLRFLWLSSDVLQRHLLSSFGPFASSPPLSPQPWWPPLVML